MRGLVAAIYGAYTFDWNDEAAQGALRHTIGARITRALAGAYASDAAATRLLSMVFDD